MFTLLIPVTADFCTDFVLSCRLKELAEPAYTQREAEAAAGMGSYTMDTQAVRATKVARAEVMDESD